jgi:hypothetical protein
MNSAEHDWHACVVPDAPADVDFEWQCGICLQYWVWRRPPQPPPQWVRHEEGS